MSASQADNSLPTEWVLLNNLDHVTISLQSVVSLYRVLGDPGDDWRYSATHADAMFAVTEHLEACVTKVSACKEALFKNYRERKGIPETDASGWWSPASLRTKPAAKKAAKKNSKKKSSAATKKVKNNGK